MKHIYLVVLDCDDTQYYKAYSTKEQALSQLEIEAIEHEKEHEYKMYEEHEGYYCNEFHNMHFSVVTVDILG